MKKLLTIAVLLTLTACAESMSTTGEYTIDTLAYTALTTEKLVLGRPCTAAVTTACVDADLAATMRDSRILLMTALTNYQTSRDAYLAASGTADSAAVAAAYASLQSAISSANAVLALDTVKAIIKYLEG